MTDARALNAVTVDVEEWFDTFLFGEDGARAASESSLPADVSKALDLLGRYSVKATFFILGSVARKYPEAVKAIAAAGHEVASHGMTHRAVARMSGEEFGRSLRESREELGALTGRPPAGYRAPTFSIFGGDAARLRTIKAEGYSYDSSLYPFPFSGRPRGPHKTDCGLLELPPSVFGPAGLTFPFLGGTFLRLMPPDFIAARLRGVNARGLPGVLYFHTWELAGAPPPGAGAARGLLQYHNSGSIAGKVSELLETFRFGTAAETLGL